MQINRNYVNSANSHWLRVWERILFKIAVMMFRALFGSASAYLSSYFTRVTDVPSRQRLRSTSNLQYRRSTFPPSANGVFRFLAPPSGTVFHHTSHTCIVARDIQTAS